MRTVLCVLVVLAGVASGLSDDASPQMLEGDDALVAKLAARAVNNFEVGAGMKKGKEQPLGAPKAEAKVVPTAAKVAKVAKTVPPAAVKNVAKPAAATPAKAAVQAAEPAKAAVAAKPVAATPAKAAVKAEAPAKAAAAPKPTAAEAAEGSVKKVAPAASKAQSKPAQDELGETKDEIEYPWKAKNTKRMQVAEPAETASMMSEHKDEIEYPKKTKRMQVAEPAVKASTMSAKKFEEQVASQTTAFNVVEEEAHKAKPAMAMSSNDFIRATKAQAAAYQAYINKKKNAGLDVVTLLQDAPAEQNLRSKHNAAIKQKLGLNNVVKTAAPAKPVNSPITSLEDMDSRITNKYRREAYRLGLAKTPELPAGEHMRYSKLGEQAYGQQKQQAGVVPAQARVAPAQAASINEIKRAYHQAAAAKAAAATPAKAAVKAEAPAKAAVAAKPAAATPAKAAVKAEAPAKAAVAAKPAAATPAKAAVKAEAPAKAAVAAKPADAAPTNASVKAEAPNRVEVAAAKKPILSLRAVNPGKPVVAENNMLPVPGAPGHKSAPAATGKPVVAAKDMLPVPEKPASHKAAATAADKTAKNDAGSNTNAVADEQKPGAGVFEKLKASAKLAAALPIAPEAVAAAKAHAADAESHGKNNDAASSEQQGGAGMMTEKGAKKAKKA